MISTRYAAKLEDVQLRAIKVTISTKRLQHINNKYNSEECTKVHNMS